MRIQLEILTLEQIARNFDGLASNHLDRAERITHTGLSYPDYGYRGWDAADRLIAAANILRRHTETLRSEATNLRDRLAVAKSTMDGWTGTEAALRAAIIGIWATDAALGEPATVHGSLTVDTTKVGQGIAVATYAGIPILFNKSSYPNFEDAHNVQYDDRGKKIDYGERGQCVARLGALLRYALVQDRSERRSERSGGIGRCVCSSPGHMPVGTDQQCAVVRGAAHAGPLSRVVAKRRAVSDLDEL